METECGVTLPDLTDFTALLPSVCVGNVGQLAVDVVLATLKPTLVTQVLHPSLIPCSGADPLNQDSSTLTTAMQLYCHKQTKLAVFQIRSGLLPGQGSKFVTDLLAWCSQHGISRIVCLASSHAHERSDVQLRGSPLRYLATSHLSQEPPLPHSFITLEKKEQFPGLCREEEPEVIFIPGGGFAKKLFVTCEEKGIQVADYLQEYLSWRPPQHPQYQVPPSWRHLFGPPPPQEMFW